MTRIFSLLPTVTRWNFKEQAAILVIISLPHSPAGRTEQGPCLIKGLLLSVALAVLTESRPSWRGEHRALWEEGQSQIHISHLVLFLFIYFTPSYSSKKKTVQKQTVQKSDHMLTWSSFSLISIYSEKKIKFKAH